MQKLLLLSDPEHSRQIAMCWLQCTPCELLCTWPGPGDVVIQVATAKHVTLPEHALLLAWPSWKLSNGLDRQCAGCKGGTCTAQPHTPASLAAQLDWRTTDRHNCAGCRRRRVAADAEAEMQLHQHAASSRRHCCCFVCCCCCCFKARRPPCQCRACRRAAPPPLARAPVQRKGRGVVSGHTHTHTHRTVSSPNKSSNAASGACQPGTNAASGAWQPWMVGVACDLLHTHNDGGM